MATIACQIQTSNGHCKTRVFTKSTEKNTEFVENVKVQIEPSDIRTQVLEIVKANKEIIDIEKLR